VQPNVVYTDVQSFGIFVDGCKVTLLGSCPTDSCLFPEPQYASHICTALQAYAPCINVFSLGIPNQTIRCVLHAARKLIAPWFHLQHYLHYLFCFVTSLSPVATCSTEIYISTQQDGIIGWSRITDSCRVRKTCPCFVSASSVTKLRLHCRLKSSGMLLHVAGRVVSDVSNDRSAFKFRLKDSIESSATPLWQRERFFAHGPTVPSGPGPARYRGFTIILRHTTLGRTPLDGWSARRRDLYLTTHNTHKRQICVPRVGFESRILANERRKSHTLDRPATGIGDNAKYPCHMFSTYNYLYIIMLFIIILGLFCISIQLRGFRINAVRSMEQFFSQPFQLVGKLRPELYWSTSLHDVS
jgi:hypothetical protein